MDIDGFVLTMHRLALTRNSSGCNSLLSGVRWQSTSAPQIWGPKSMKAGKTAEVLVLAESKLLFTAWEE